MAPAFTGEAQELKRARDRRFYERHGERLREFQRSHYAVNAERIKARVSKRAYEAKAAAIAQLGGVCMHCGFDHPAALQFHHRDPATKSFTVTTNALTSPKKYPKSVIDAEIAKCDLLCANCHFIHHSAWEPYR